MSNIAGAPSHMDRLRASARDALSADQTSRLQLVYRDKFIIHDQAQLILDQLLDALARPPSERPPGFALCGPSSCGKTALINYLCRQVAELKRPEPDADFPILIAKTISRATEPRTWLSIARALSMTIPNGNARVPMSIGDSVIRRLKLRKIQMLVMSQFSHVEPVSRDERRHVFDLLQSLSDEGIIVVVVGTESILDLIAEEEELETRLRPLHLGSLRPIKAVLPTTTQEEIQKSTEVMRFLMALESHYPFSRESGLFETKRARSIYKQAGGRIGKIVELCNEAAAWSLRNGHECIPDEAFKRCSFFTPNFTAPSR